MKCIKNTKRTFFNLFEIFSCDNCFESIQYDYIYIGNNIINIYSFNNNCINKEKRKEFIGLFLKETILNNLDIYLILSENEYEKIFDYLPLLLESDSNIYILIL